MTRPIHDAWLRIIGISLFSALSLVGDGTFLQPLTPRTLVLIGLQVASIALTWQLNRAVATYCRYKAFAHLPATNRLSLTLLACVSATTVFAWVFNTIRHGVEKGSLARFSASERSISHFSITIGNESLRLNAYGIDFLHAIFVCLFYVTIYELLFYRQDSAHYQEQLAQAEREREEFRVANLQSQLEVLKSQVNPHFLFNALNSLSSLISEDPRQAEVFVDKLSGVYRYVLRANRGDQDGVGSEQHLTTLAAELQFIDAYYHLLQTRYGAGLTLGVSVDDARRPCQLPPLTLQLLVENAVKHNVISAKRPLHIQISTDAGGQLVVQNNIQRKASRALSNGVGLSTIVAKYQMLKLPQPTIDESAEEFTVRLPLLLCADAPLTKPIAVKQA